MEEVLRYLNYTIRTNIEDFLNGSLEYSNNLEEIRLRCNRPIALKIKQEIKILNHIITVEEILETFEKICENSVYSYKKEICEGFITIKGGHRVGITGNCVIENGQIININYISSLNFRIAREKISCSQNILNYIIKNNRIYNTIIVSAPGAGKTTLLRDIVRNISDKFMKTVGLVDERGEIASMYKGIPQKNVGILTDVITNVSKAKGMNMLIRSMAPEVIACDEIGSKEDIDAINYAICSGTKGIFTSHGNSFEEIYLNNNLKEFIDSNIIERIFILDNKEKGKINETYYLDNEKRKYLKF